MAHRLRLIVGEVDDAQLLTPADGALLAFASPDCAVPPDKVESLGDSDFSTDFGCLDTCFREEIGLGVLVGLGSLAPV